MNETNANKRVSFGVMLNSLTVEHWQRIAIEKLLESGCKLQLIIVNDNEEQTVSFTKKLISYPWSKLVFRLYNRFILKPKSKKKTPITDLTDKVSIFKCKTQQKKYSDYFLEKDIEEIRKKNLDFILRFGFNIIRGEILNVCKYGIWSYHHDDELKYRGGPPGFWEIYHNDDVNGIILQKLTSNLDAGYILKKGYYRTIRHSYSGNIDQIYYESTSWPIQLAKNPELYASSPAISHSDAKIYHEPDNWQMLKFFFKILYNKIRFHLRELYLIEDWNIAYTKYSFKELLDKGLPHSFHFFPKKSKTSFKADPFLFQSENKLFALYENYSYKNQKGRIDLSVIDRESMEITKSKSVIEEDFHLSYPFVFNYNGNTFCIPESFEAKQVRLYKYNKRSLSFKFDRVLIDNIDAIDTTFLEYNNKCWLFFTRKDHPSVKLYIYYARNLFEEFTAHPGNPVKTDIRNARPAGHFIKYKNKIYRPSQDNSSTYGKKIVINQVLKLTEKEFEEKEVKFLYPPKNFSRFNKGIHTINFCNEYLIIDLKRFSLLWINFVFQLKRKLKRMLNLEH